MNKPSFVISCPIDIYSGYSSRSRDLARSIIELDKYDVKILEQQWGNCPNNFIDDNEEEWGFLRPYLTKQLTQKPDIWMQITIPSEFQPVGKFNIGCTAGIETTVCDGSWIERLNRMDVNWVSSNHSKNVFQSLNFEKRDQQGNSLGQLKLEKPIEVVFEGCNLLNYFPIPNAQEDIFGLDGVKEKFCFLFLGHWMQGGYGADRKNVGVLVNAFYNTFKNTTNPPALILKTSTGTSSYMSRDEILKRILQIRKTIVNETLPNIYVLNGNISDEEMNNLYNHPRIKVMISLSSGEGYCRPLAEFSMVNKPIITTNWSGQLDFLDPSLTTLLPGELKQVHPSAVNQWILKDAKWFEVDQVAAMTAMKGVFNNYKNYQTKAIKQGYINRNKFSYEKMKELIDTLLTRDVPKFSQFQPLNLPKLTKIE